MIFRGFLFRAMLSKDKTIVVAIIYCTWINVRFCNHKMLRHVKERKQIGGKQKGEKNKKPIDKVGEWVYSVDHYRKGTTKEMLYTDKLHSEIIMCCCSYHSRAYNMAGIFSCRS